jgi:hypothetical protein
MCQNPDSSQCTRVCSSLKGVADRVARNFIRWMLIMMTLQTILYVEIISLFMTQDRLHHHYPETHSVATPRTLPARQHSTS